MLGIFIWLKELVEVTLEFEYKNLLPPRIYAFLNAMTMDDNGYSQEQVSH